MAELTLTVDGNVCAIEMLLIERPEAAPSGAAEMALGLVPAAIGNARFDAIRVRLRRVPFTPERVKAALDRA
jgi:CO/xanthine dehydrogenase Mo-binding subunit